MHAFLRINAGLLRTCFGRESGMRNFEFSATLAVVAIVFSYER